MPVAQVYRFWGEVQSRDRSWLQVAAYEERAAAPSGAHLQDILVLQIRVVDRMEIQLDAQPIPFIRRPQGRDIDCRRGRIAIVHERPIRRRYTSCQGLITGSPQKSPDGHRPSYCSVESTAGVPTSAIRRDRLHPSPTSLAGPPSDVGGPVSGRVASTGRVTEEPSWRPGWRVDRDLLSPSSTFCPYPGCRDSAARPASHRRDRQANPHHAMTNSVRT